MISPLHRDLEFAILYNKGLIYERRSFKLLEKSDYIFMRGFQAVMLLVMCFFQV
jgi:hypothetical protein